MSARLSQEEIALAAKYDNILCDYMSEIGEDITMDLAPPRSTIITIRCCEDYGMGPLTRAPCLQAFWRNAAIQGYLAHKKPPPPPRTTI